MTTTATSWKRVRRAPCWTNWTFGPWYAVIGRREYAGFDLGPFVLLWRRPSRRRPTNRKKASQ